MMFGQGCRVCVREPSPSEGPKTQQLPKPSATNSQLAKFRVDRVCSILSSRSPKTKKKPKPETLNPKPPKAKSPNLSRIRQPPAVALRTAAVLQPTRPAPPALQAGLGFTEGFRV